MKIFVVDYFQYDIKEEEEKEKNAYEQFEFLKEREPVSNKDVAI